MNKPNYQIHIDSLRVLLETLKDYRMEGFMPESIKTLNEIESSFKESIKDTLFPPKSSPDISPFLEDIGYSYSGMSNFLDGDDNSKRTLLIHELDSQYNLLVEEKLNIEKKRVNIKKRLDITEHCLDLFRKIMIDKGRIEEGDPIVFKKELNEDMFVMIEMEDKKVSKYKTFPRVDIDIRY